MAFGRDGLASRIVPSQVPFQGRSCPHVYNIYTLQKTLESMYKESKNMPDPVMIQLQLQNMLKISAIRL